MEASVNYDVRVILNIREGKGFEQISLPTLIVATLDGHSLETAVVESCSEPQYDHDLVWEVDKNKLRKMRSGHVPLKLECFAVKSDDHKEKLGYLLLNLRSAQVFSKNDNINVRTNWHKLLGLKGDLKIHKPELLLSLSIHHQDPTQLELKNSEEYQQTALESPKIGPILLRDERLIQLGPLYTCQELFLLNITAVSAANVDLLLPPNCYADTSNNVYFWCKILENDIYFNQSNKNYGELWTLNEEIVIRIRSSLRVLKDYLQLKPFLFIYLKYKENIVGQSEVNLRPLIPTDNIEEFMKFSESSSNTLHQRCYLHKTDKNDGAEYKNSYLDLQLKLQYVGDKMIVGPKTPSTVISDHNIPDSAKELKTNLNQTKSRVSEIDCHRNPAGDFVKYFAGAPLVNLTSRYNSINKHSLSCEAIKSQPVKAACSQSADILLNQSDINDYSKSVEAYHCYCLNILIIAIKLTSPALAITNAEIRFHHPKTEIVSSFYPNVPFSLGEKIKLQDIECKLHFVSAVDEIGQLLLSFPPKISIYKREGDSKKCVCQSAVDMKQLFHQNKTEYLCDVPLYDMEQKHVGNLDVLFNLEDHGPYYRIKKSIQSEYMGPPILDDSLAYKIVDELETWKERQMEIFKVELKRKEDRHLNLLSQEWQKQKENLEAKLACSVEQCKMLANSLNNATEDLRTRRLKSLEKEARLIKANEDLQFKYEAKVRQLKESYHSMQEELASKIDILEKKKILLEGQVEQLSTENERLQLLVAKQSEELEGYQKGSLTQDQTASLLQELKILEEKLQNAQENKCFFKEQWAKAVREMHNMRKEYQEVRQVQIKNSKEELQNLNLEEILCTDSNALTNDQMLLSEIQKEIDVIKPKSSFTDRSVYCQVFTPASMDSKILQNNNKGTLRRSEENDKRLQALLEERNSLLKTGSYTIDDTVIMKLNAEIRSLMMK